MERRPGWQVALVVAGLLAAATPCFAAEDEDPCAGKNPAYCGKDDTAPKAAPEDCEGRNPIYCKPEPAPTPPPAKDDDSESAKGRAGTDSQGDSRNPAHNPHQNPHQNPHRRPARSSAGK